MFERRRSQPRVLQLGSAKLNCFLIVFLVWFLFFQVWFQFLVPKTFQPAEGFKYSSTVSESPHLISGDTPSRGAGAEYLQHSAQTSRHVHAITRVGESRVGSNHMCLGLRWNPKLRSRSTRGPLGPKVEQAAARILSNTRHI